MSYTIDELKHVCLFPSHGVQEYPTQDMDEVYPGIFLGNAASAADIDRLHKHNVGYVLNAAHGTDASLFQLQVHSKEDYEKHGIAYFGVEALDMSSYPLHKHFKESTDFIRRGLQSGKSVLVHCRMGISRSAALVVAFLIEAEKMDCKEAMKLVRSRREIFPNDGFMQQLAQYKPNDS